MKMPAIGENLKQCENYYRRTCRPRMKWVEENCKYMYKKLTGREFDFGDQTCVDELIELAIEKKF